MVHNVVEQMADTGVIDMRVGFEEPDSLVIELDAPYPEDLSGRVVDDTGLENIRLRLNDHYGEQANMRVDTGSGRISVRISHPAFETDDQHANIIG